MYQIMRLLSEVMLARAGFDENQIEGINRAPSVPDWAAAQMSEVQRNELSALRELGVRGRFMDASELSETMTTAHFAVYFTDTLSRLFYRDYQYQGGAWRDYVFPDTAPDFREVKRFRMTEPENLVLRGEKETHKDTFIQPSYVHYGVLEYSRKFSVSWRALLNDDLGKIRETPQRMGNAARRTLDAFVSNLYDNATSQAALVALGAVYAGTGRLTLPNLAIGVNAMRQRVDGLGNPIDTGRIRLVIPPVLEVQAAQVLRDVIAYGGPTSNVIGTFIAGYSIDPYIAFASPNVPWYLFAEPSNIPAVTLLRLQGWSAPVVAMKQSDIQIIMGSAPAAFTMGDLDTGNIHYMVEDVYGGNADATNAGITDVNGLYYSSGTTP